MLKIAIFIFDDVEVLDFAGPFEVFSVCGLRSMSSPPFEVFTVAERKEVTARNRLTIIANYTLNDMPAPDIILVPGGGGYTADGLPFGTRKEMDNPTVVNWVKHWHHHTQLTLSVCTGSLILARAGLLDGLKATTHWKAFDAMRTAAPTTELIENVRWVDNGKIILSAGVSAGIDMSFHVISRLLGKAVADETAQYMQYDYWK